MIYEIKRDNVVIFQHEIKGKRTQSAPAVDFVDIEFDYYEAILLKRNDTIEFDGQIYYCDKQYANYQKKSNNLYNHRARFVSENYRATEIAVLDPQDVSKFEIEGNLLTLLTLAVDNLNRVSSGWSYATPVPNTVTKLFVIEEENVMSFLTKMSGEFEIPFYIKNKVVTFANPIHQDGGVFEYGKGKGFLDLRKSYINNTKVPNTVYATGGDGLVLDNPVVYTVDINVNGVIEGFYNNDDIKPTTRTQVVGITSTENVVTTNLINYDIQAQKIAGQTPLINFETGALAGYSFYITNSTYDTSTNVTVIYLKKRTVDGALLPSTSVRALAGDYFNITNIRQPQAIIDEAKTKLEQKARQFLENGISKNLVLEANLDPLYEENLQLNNRIKVVDVDLDINGDFVINEIKTDLQNLNKKDISLDYIGRNIFSYRLYPKNDNIIDLSIQNNYDDLVVIEDEMTLVKADTERVKVDLEAVEVDVNDLELSVENIETVELPLKENLANKKATLDFEEVDNAWYPNISAVKVGLADTLSQANNYTTNAVNNAVGGSGVVNSVNGVNVDNTDPKNPIVAEFRPIAGYNSDISNIQSQLNTKLESTDLDGFIYDVQYSSATHTITFYQQNEPNIVIDLPIEQLIKGVQLVGDDLVFTFEDGSTVTVPLNTLLVGVVKSVNGLTPNSQGEVVINIADIPGLSSELANKLDIRMAGLVSNLTQPEKDAILTKLGVVNNIVQVLGLSGNIITLSNGGGSISLNIANIGGLQSALDLKADISQIPTNYITTNTTQTGLTGNKTTSGVWTFNSQINTANHGNSSQWNHEQWGLGLITPPDSTPAQADVLSNTQFFKVNDATSGWLASGYYYAGINISTEPNRRLQLVGKTGESRYYIRRYSSGWHNDEIIHTDNLDSQATLLGFIKSSALPTVNNGLLTISTSSDLTGGGTFSANQATASNVIIGLSAGTLTSLALANTALQSGDNVSELNNDVGYLTSFTETDPTVPSWVKAISQNDINNWNDASGLSHDELTLGANSVGLDLDVATQTLELDSGFQIPTTIKIGQWDDAYLLRHSHSNKGVLDNLTQSVIDNSHTHSNKVVLDGITAQLISNWNTAYTQRHTHANKALLDTYNQTNANITDAVYLRHSHTNKSILDAITAAFTTAEKTKLSGIEAGAEVNVNADWNATSGDAEILNKPVIPAQLVYTGSNGINVTGAVISPTYGTTANTIAQGNDARINNGQTAFGWGNFRDYGLGLTTQINSTPAQADSVANTRFFRVDDARPDWLASGYYYAGINISTEPNRRLQLVGKTGESRYYIRRYSSGWHNDELFHTGNLNPAQYVLQSALNTQFSNYVPINGVTTINNTKTFTSSPVVPNGTLAGHTVNLGQLNNILDDYATETWVNSQNFSTQTLTAGSNISIVGNVISATDTNTTYTAGAGLSLTGTTFANTAPNATHTGDVTGATALTIANGVVSNAKMANMGIGIKGRNTGTGAPMDLTVVQAQSMLNIQTPNNGSFTVQGTGYLTGSGSTSANATANTSASLDLTNNAKNDIQKGVSANAVIENYFAAVERYFFNHDVQTDGTTVDTYFNVHTFVTTTGVGAGTVDIIPHELDGAELVIQGNVIGLTRFYLDWMDPAGNVFDYIDLEAGSQRFFWIKDLDLWKIV